MDTSIRIQSPVISPTRVSLLSPQLQQQKQQRLEGEKSDLMKMLNESSATLAEERKRYQTDKAIFSQRLGRMEQKLKDTEEEKRTQIQALKQQLKDTEKEMEDRVQFHKHLMETERNETNYRCNTQRK